MIYKVALLHYSSPPVVGGVEEIIRQQASLFHRYHHFVKIFVGEGSQFTDKYKVECNPLLSSKKFSPDEFDLSSKKGAAQTAKKYSNEIYDYLKKVLTDFDVAIVHNVLSMPYNLPFTYAVHRIAQENILSVVGWNHDSPFFYKDYPSYLDGFPWNILKQYNKHIHYVTISESRKKLFSNLYGNEEEITVIPDGIDPVKFFQLDPLTLKLIQERRLFEADFIMVQPSRLHPRKNIELSIQVTCALKRLGCEAKMLITGAYDPHHPDTWNYYTKLKKLVDALCLKEDIIIIAEYLFESGERLQADRIIMRDLYLIADILFLPSTQEGFGIPLLESGMIKLPIVCSDIPPFREIGGEDVCFFDPEEPPEKIAKKVLDFAENLKPHRMFRRIIKNYVWDNIYHHTLLPYIKRITGKV